MSGELSLLKCWRSEDHFDLGELNLPFDRRVKLWKWWHYPLVLIVILVIA